MTEPQHDLVDFVALASVLTNEQRIMNALESIEGMLKARFAPTPVKPEPLEIPKALRRK
jgi:hypothetical protein